MGWRHPGKHWLIRKIQNKVHCTRFQSNKGIRLWRNFSPYRKHQAWINIGYYYKAFCNIVWFYKEVLNSSNAHRWIQVMYEEIESLKENDVFELTELFKMSAGRNPKNSTACLSGRKVNCLFKILKFSRPLLLGITSSTLQPHFLSGGLL